MPKIGMEPIRRRALIDAAIAAIGERGSLDVTVSQIARRAGVSSALAHHYFGNKEEIYIAVLSRTLANWLQPLEDLEPLTTGALRHFIRTHRLVQSVPLAMNLDGFREIRLVGDVEACRKLAWAMVSPK